VTKGKLFPFSEKGKILNEGREGLSQIYFELREKILLEK
jgi:hypothetical protein